MGRSKGRKSKKQADDDTVKNGDATSSSDDEPIASSIRGSSRYKSKIEQKKEKSNGRRASSRKRSRGQSDKSDAETETDASSDEEQADDNKAADKKRSATRAAPKKGKAAKKDEKKKKTKDDEVDKEEEEEEEEEVGDSEEEYEVEAIVGHKFDYGKKKFRVRWKGYGSEDDTWQQEYTLSCPELIAEYKKEHPDAKGKRAPKKRKKSQPYRPKVPKLDELDDYDENDIDENQDWEVERILDVHYNRKEKTRDFLIRWKGYSYKSDSWEPEENLNCTDLIEAFMNKISNISEKELRIIRQPTQRFTLMTQQRDRRLSKRLDGRQRVEYYDSEL